jgi:hypothetical protein
MEFLLTTKKSERNSPLWSGEWEAVLIRQPIELEADADEREEPQEFDR